MAPTSTDKQPALTPDMVGFRLLKLTNLLSRPFFGQFAKQHELTLTEWRTIVVLATHPGSAAQDIAAMTGLHPMNISRALAGLRQAGRVEEARDPDNHRRTLLWLTKSGEKTFRDIAPHSERQAARLLDALSPSELSALAKIVDKLIARAEEIAAAE
jgi:DNA-binding MarR family transcriptional regulator